MPSATHLYKTNLSNVIEFVVHRRKKRLLYSYIWGDAKLPFFLICLDFSQINVKVPLECLILVWRQMRLLVLLAVISFLFDTLGDVSKQQGVRKICHVVHVRASRRLVISVYSDDTHLRMRFETVTCTAANTPGTKLTTTEYLPKLYTMVCAKVV